VSFDQAAHILAMSKRTLMQLMDTGELPTVRVRGRQGRLLHDDVETYAAANFRLRRYSRPDSYFVTTAGAAEHLGVSRPRVIQLGDKGFLPYLVARNGWRLYRRQQIQVVANSRLARGRGSR
jgi:excisionase family DNA binding protein